jgi:hypothetical protein
VAGKLPPETENPVPVVEAELIVTATVPLEVTVTDFVTAVPTETLPNDSDVELRLNAGVAAFSCIAKVREEALVLADNVAVCDVLTDAALAVNDAVDAPETTVTLAGAVTALSLLDTVTLSPPDGAVELRDTVHAVEPAPVNELLPHENALIEGASVEPDPLRLIVVTFEADPAVAVKVTVCEVVKLATVAAKLAFLEPEGTATVAGTVTVPLLLARLTVIPPVGAAALNVTVQGSVPAPIIEEFAQLTPDSADDDEVEPLPCNLTAPATFVFVLVVALTLSCAVESVAVPGS